MKYTFHTDTDPAVMDQFVIHSDQNSLYQTHEWAALKDNWDSAFVSARDENNEIAATALVLIRRLVMNKTLMYIPRGPVMDWHNEELVRFMLDSLKEFGKKHHAVDVRFDPNVIYKKYPFADKDLPQEPMNTEVIEFLKAYGAKHRGFTTMISEATQPKYNVVMKIDQDWESRLVKNTRQSIRTAVKRGAEVHEGREYIPELAEALHATETRKHVALRNAEYFEHMADVYGDHSLIMVAELDFNKEIERLEQERAEIEQQLQKETAVKKQNQLNQRLENIAKDLELTEQWRNEEGRDKAVLCGKMVCFNEKRMEFFYMGNNTKYMRIRANYLLYSKCLQRCADLNIPVCSFGGVDGTLDDGIAMFKSAWPVEIEEYIGEFNIVLDPAAYQLFEKVYPKILEAAVRLRSRG